MRLRAALALVALSGSACAATNGATTPRATTTTSAPKATTSSTTARPVAHVMVVMMENKGFSQVIGQADQPYTNSLARDYGLATASYSSYHPSLPNYLDIVSGSNQGVTDDNPPSSHRFPGVPTVADQLVRAGFSANAYAEDLPADPGASGGEYAVRHVPWEYFPDAQIALVDASSLDADLDAADAPDFVWYTPNLIDDEHDGTVEQGDAFLSKFIPGVQSSAWYRAGGEIIIEWDESDGANAGINGGDGGHIATIVVSDALQARPVQESTPVDTAGILRSIEDVYGLGYLGAAANPAHGTIDALLGATGVHPAP